MDPLTDWLTEEWKAGLDSIGLDYGALPNVTVSIWCEDGEIKSRIITPEKLYPPPQKAT